MVSVLISTWGDHRSWENVTYIMGGREHPTPAKSSLPVILNNASPKPERVYLIVLDTVIKHLAPSYESLRDSVVAYYQNFLQSLNLDVQVEIIVAPGVGKFKLDNQGQAEFRGFLTDFQANVSFELMQRFLQLGGNELTVHLDLTHGVNFMPSLTYAVMCEVLGALAIAKKVHLKVYNAEPYIRGVTTTLNIHNVEDRDFQPHIKNEALQLEGRLLEPGIVDEKEKVEVPHVLRNMRLPRVYVDELNAFLSSLVNGLPLVYYTFYPEVDHLENLLTKVADLWMSEVKVVINGNDMRIYRRVKFGKEFVKCAIVWAVAKALNHSRKGEVTLTELRNLREGVFLKWTKLSSMISYDLEEVRRNVQNYGIPGTWVKLSEIVKESHGQGRGQAVIWRLFRNFLAHSGLERTLIYVKRQRNEIWLSYNLKSEDERRTILGACLRGLYQSAT